MKRKRKTFWCWRVGSWVQSTCCSYGWPRVGAHTHTVAHKHLWLQFRGIWPLLISKSTGHSHVLHPYMKAKPSYTQNKIHKTNEACNAPTCTPYRVHLMLWRQWARWPIIWPQVSTSKDRQAENSKLSVGLRLNSVANVCHLAQSSFSISSSLHSPTFVVLRLFPQVFPQGALFLSHPYDATTELCSTPAALQLGSTHLTWLFSLYPYHALPLPSGRLFFFLTPWTLLWPL